MKMQTIKIELLQGDNSPIVISTELTEACKLKEVSGTLAYRLLKLRLKAKKFRMNLGGFSFARKFDVKISIGEKFASGSESIGLSAVQFGITIQDKEESQERFHGFISELVNDILCGDSKIEGEFAELKEDLCLN